MSITKMLFESDSENVQSMVVKSQRDYLATEAVQSAALALESVDDVHGGDGLAFGVLGVGDRIADDVLQEDLQHASGLLVDQTGNTLHTATTGQTTDGRLGDALDVVAEHLPVTLRTTFAQTLASLATARHDCRTGRESSDELSHTKGEK